MSVASFVRHDAEGFVPHDHAFDEVFEDYVLSRTEDREQDGRLHPSALYFCDRKLVYDLRLTPREPTSGSKRPLLVGKVLHSELQSALEHAVGKTIRTLYIEPLIDSKKLNVTGHADAVVQWMDDSWEVIEFKTANSRAFSLAVKSGQAKADHINQALTYAYMVRTEGFFHGPDESQFHPAIPEMGRVRVVYLEKNKHPIFETTYPLTDDWEEQFLNHIAAVSSFEGDDLPPRLDNGSWQCGYCPYAIRCWAD